MSNEKLDKKSGSDRAADMRRQVFMGIIYRSAALVIFMVFILIYFPSSVFFYPALYAAVIVYAGSMISLLIAGKMSGPLLLASAVFGLTIFLYISLPVQDMSTAARGLGTPVLVTGIIGTIHCLSRALSEFTGVVTRALLIASLGVLYYSAFTAVKTPVLSDLTMLALIAFVSTAIYSVPGLLKRHSNEQISYAGKQLSRIENPAIVSVIVAAIMTYTLMIRQSLTSMGSFGLGVIEWAALSGIVLFIFIKIRSTMFADASQSLLDIYGTDGGYSDKVELEKAAKYVESFVDEGKKEGLVMIMAAALIDNDIPAQKAQSILSLIIGHEDDKEPPIMFRWAVGNIDEANRKKRMKAVNEMMAAAESAIDTARDTGKKHRHHGPAGADPAAAAE